MLFIHRILLFSGLFMVGCFSSSGGGSDSWGDTGDAGGSLCGSETATAFRITAISATAPERQSDGADWDVGSYPDLFVCMGTDDDYACTQTASDTLSATFNSYHDVTVLDEGFIQLWDEDLTDHDFILGWNLALSWLRLNAECGQVPLMEGDGSIVLEVNVI